METFTFKVTQPATTYFRGNLYIEASSEKSAIKKAKKMSQEELENSCEDWEISLNGADTDGDIEVWDDEGNQLN